MTGKVALGAALNKGLHCGMEEDPTVVVMGQDVGQLGGVFRVTDGLASRFGSDRVIDTPLAESGIVGTAIGLALRGYRPVCEIQFDGFVYPAFDQIVSQLAKMRARSRGLLKLPVVLRIPVGGGIGAVEHHSESNEAYFAHTAGLRVVSCSNPNDAYHMIQQAIQSDDPVVFYEPKRRYWDKGELSDTPELGLHSAAILENGTDATLVAHGPTVAIALAAAQAAAEDGFSVGVIDLRSISPLDVETIKKAAAQSHRIITVHEASTFMGIGAEIAAQVSKECFYELEAPVVRVGAFDLPYPPAHMENQFLPNVDRVLDALNESFGY